MPPDSDGLRTIACRLDRIVPDRNHFELIQEAVLNAHKATIFASELLNIHIRRLLQKDIDVDLKDCFSANWVLNVYNEVTYSTRKVKVVPELQTSRLMMPAFDPPDRSGIQQCLLYDARNLVTVAATNVWMHFHKRVLSHVRIKFALTTEEYDAMTNEERKARKLILMQVATDVCKNPSDAYQSPITYHSWIENERNSIGLNDAVQDWKDKPLLYHLKVKPHRFVRCMYAMSKEKEAQEAGSFALYPLRRSLVPKHVRFDQKALRDLLHLGQSDYIKEKAKKRKLMNETEIDCTVPSRKRTREEMLEENTELFSRILDLRSVHISKQDRFDFAFTTDGVGCRIQVIRIKNSKTVKASNKFPKRGIWAIDELKKVTRSGNVHVIGIDPGKRELICATDMKDTKKTIRYTLDERRRDLCVKQYAKECNDKKPDNVLEAEKALSAFNSRSACLDTFRAYCTQRHKTLEASLAFYSQPFHRHQRWKKVIKEQKSEEKLYNKIRQMKTDSTPLVLAYGAWGLIAGKDACKRGNPPCIGVGLMKKLAKRFVVSPTPEHCTSKTCFRCFSPCGPWTDKEAEMGKKIRGLRLCTQRDCMLPLNRDKNASINIGNNFTRLLNGMTPLVKMTNEELSFHKSRLCLECNE